MNMRVLVTGSSGLIGSEAVRYYDSLQAIVVGIDNNMRADFFGPGGDTTWNLNQLKATTSNFTHFSVDIRNQKNIFDLFKQNTFDVIIHCAAQPSHDKAREIPVVDFEVNALGTLNLLEATRLFCSKAVFIYMSTNKVYGDAPNEMAIVEQSTRYDYADAKDFNGISEACRIDQCMHSLFGASKTAADIMAQEYGRYFGLKTGIFRGGCLTGPSHSGVQLHGFLNYLVKVALEQGVYKVFGYKGKQVRDNIHSFDVIQLFEEFRKNPKCGEVYNLGGGRNNSISVLEAIDAISRLTGRALKWEYADENRKGDHVCYISDLRKIKKHFPEWKITRTIDDILEEMVKKSKVF